MTRFCHVPQLRGARVSQQNFQAPDWAFRISLTTTSDPSGGTNEFRSRYHSFSQSKAFGCGDTAYPEIRRTHQAPSPPTHSLREFSNFEPHAKSEGAFVQRHPKAPTLMVKHVFE